MEIDIDYIIIIIIIIIIIVVVVVVAGREGLAEEHREPRDLPWRLILILLLLFTSLL